MHQILRPGGVAAEPEREAVQRVNMLQMRTYFHTPEAVEELCRELGLACRASGYRFW